MYIFPVQYLVIKNHLSILLFCDFFVIFYFSLLLHVFLCTVLSIYRMQV